MFGLEALEMIFIFLGLFIVGLGFLISVAGIGKKRVDHRREFFRLVETARELEILEKKPVAYNVSGTWKGEGDGYFGVGTNLELQITQNQSELSGRIIDQFGYSEVRGFFVWPYLWFDFERHGTVFEFRGIIKESNEGAFIAGKYRYFQQDANWTVKRIGAPPPLPAPSAVPGESGESGRGSKPQSEETKTASGSSNVTDGNSLNAEGTSSRGTASRETASSETGSSETAPLKPESKPIIFDMDNLPSYMLEEPPVNIRKQVPTSDGTTHHAQYRHGAIGKCPNCDRDFEELLSFCMYCGEKKETV